MSIKINDDVLYEKLNKAAFHKEKNISQKLDGEDYLLSLNVQETDKIMIKISMLDQFLNS